MTVLAADEPISPELVLVSPPEAAQHARSTLPVPVWWRTSFERELGRVELATVRLFCLAMTVGPMLFFIALRP